MAFHRITGVKAQCELGSGLLHPMAPSAPQAMRTSEPPWATQWHPEMPLAELLEVSINPGFYRADGAQSGTAGCQFLKLCVWLDTNIRALHVHTHQTLYTPPHITYITSYTMHTTCMPYNTYYAPNVYHKPHISHTTLHTDTTCTYRTTYINHTCIS